MRFVLLFMLEPSSMLDQLKLLRQLLVGYLSKSLDEAQFLFLRNWHSIDSINCMRGHAYKRSLASSAMVQGV